MGFDVDGVLPINEIGQYFRVSIWGWRPLWDMICNNTKILSMDDRIKGHMNDGEIFRGQKHRAIIQTLSKLVRDKPERVERQAESGNWGRMPDGRPIGSWDLMMFGNVEYWFTWDAAQHFLEFCEANRGFKVR